jgi:hypothetical protein
VARARYVLLVCAALAVPGCGGGSTSGSSSAARESTSTTSAPQPSHPARRPGSAARRRADAVRIRVPRGWQVPARSVRRRNWPVPLKIAASFPIHHVSGNASCPYNVLRRMPPDGVYILVAEFTTDRPAGVPPRGQLPPRGDLGRLDLRPAEVECWDHGLSGAKDFTENGRSFRVEILLGARVSAERRRRALEALASLRIPPARP